MEKETIRYERLQTEDLDELVAVMKNIMVENDSHSKDIFDRDYWQWKYAGGEGVGNLVYVGKNEAGKIISNYHFKLLDGKYPSGSTKYAMLQDVAVSPDYRNYGIFKNMSLFAKEDMEASGIRVVETFPNANSIHSLRKHTAYTVINVMPSYIQIYDGGFLASQKIKLGFISRILGSIPSAILGAVRRYRKPKNFSIKFDQSIDQDLLDLYSEFSDSYEFGLIRDADFLNWRFIEKPGNKHHFGKIYDDSGRLMAVGVFRIDEVMDVRCVMLLDIAYLPGHENYLLQLLTEIRKGHKKYFGEPIGLLYTAMNSRASSMLPRAGMIKLPTRFNPREISLMVHSTENLEGFYTPENWQATLADWDVL